MIKYSTYRLSLESMNIFGIQFKLFQIMLQFTHFVADFQDDRRRLR